MKTVIMLLQALCGDDRTLYHKVSQEIREIITCERDGLRQADATAAVNLAFELELSDYAGAMVSRRDAYRMLKKGARDLNLVEKLLAKKGANFVASSIDKDAE